MLLLDFLSATLHDPAFQADHKCRAHDFTRKRQLDFPILFCLLANLRHCSADKELTGFFRELTGGRRACVILQDVYAKVFAVALTAMLALDVHAQIDSRTAHREHDYQINWSNALASMRNWGMLFLIKAKGLCRNLALLFQSFMRGTNASRPGRSFPRRTLPYCQAA